MSRVIYPKQFIQEVLIDEIGDITKRHAYLSFGVICSGIEFLGRCISEKSWDDRNNKTPFLNAITTLFPTQYHQYKDELYSSLRCGLHHLMTPGKILITEKKNDPGNQWNKSNHPISHNGNIILVIEYFYDDFVSACEMVVSDQYTSSKMAKPLIKVGAIS